MSGGVVVPSAPRDAALPRRAAPSSGTRPVVRSRHRPTHRRSRTPRRAGWSGVAVLVVAVSAAGWSQVRTQDQASATDVTAPAQVGTSVAAHAVTCWNGSTAARLRACGLPQGRAGMATVFPAITTACVTGAATRPGSVEVYLCHGDGYVARYTRWPVGYDRFALLDQVNHSRGAPWTVAGDFAGRAWSSTDRWAATYRAFPYSVEVIATSAAGRAAGVAAARFVPPGHVGRGPR